MSIFLNKIFLEEIINNNLPDLIFLGILFLFFFSLVLIYYSKRRKASILSSMHTTLFELIMPRYAEKEEKGKKKEKELIEEMEQVYSSFYGLPKGNFWQRLFDIRPSLSLEIASQIGGKDISFYVAVPDRFESAFKKYIHGVYPRAVVRKIPQDYTIFEPEGSSSGAYLRLTHSPFFPINTYKNLEKDPLSTITNTLTKINPDEGTGIQVIIRPSSWLKWEERGKRVISEIKSGESVGGAIAHNSSPILIRWLSDLVELLSKSNQKKPEPGKPVDEDILKAIHSKIQKRVFEANIRLIASAETKDRADEILRHLEGSFEQFSLAPTNGFKAIELKGRSLKKLFYQFSFRNYSPRQRIILNLEELASVYHFPTSYTQTPYVKLAQSTSSVPPLNLPSKGPVRLGKVNFRGEIQDVYFASRKDRRRHFYIVGQTGTGKSSLMREMIRQDIENGEGVGVLDPHGELIEDTLANIPPNRISDVVLFEPFDVEHPSGLNMLEYKTQEQKDFAVQEMISIFHKLFPPEITGPMFEHYMRNAMLALMADKDNPGTLVEIPRIFTDDEFMTRKLSKVKDPLVRNFWLKEWRKTTGSTKSDMLGYVVSKVGRFVEDSMMRNIIGQSHSSFDLEEIMNHGKIFLANLSKGLTGEVNSSLLGLILVSKMQMAAMRRTEITEEQRRDFYLYLDEFQNFTTNSIVSILSEARKYRLNLILAHQYISQLTPDIKGSVLGNVGSIAAFRLGVEDAEFLEKQFKPEFSHFDLANLDNFNLILKMIINGQVASPFKMETYPPKIGNYNVVNLVKKISKEKYSQKREVVEKKIFKETTL